MDNLYRVSGWHEVVRKIVERSVLAPNAGEAVRWAESNGMWHVVVSLDDREGGVPQPPGATPRGVPS